MMICLFVFFFKKNKMSSIDEDEIIRLQVAEEAVRIVRQFNSTKGKEERQKKIIDLCTDIAGILDAKRRSVCVS